jgi:hypothetical protein
MSISIYRGRRLNTLTEFPKLFEDTYWGRGTLDGLREDEKDEIIKNRNRFAKRYKLKNYVTPMEQTKTARDTLLSKFDHAEFYTTEDGDKILIVSPYNKSLPQDDEFGGIKIPPLYNLSCTTTLYYRSRSPEVFVRSKSPAYRLAHI